MSLDNIVAFSVIGAVGAYVLGAWIAFLVRYCRGGKIVFEALHAESNTSFNIYKHIENVASMLVLSVLYLFVGAFISVGWQLFLPFVIMLAIIMPSAQYLHRKNRRVLDAVDEIKGN